MQAPHRLSLTLKFHLFLQSGSAAVELLHFLSSYPALGGAKWRAWSHIYRLLAGEVYTSSIQRAFQHYEGRCFKHGVALPGDFFLYAVTDKRQLQRKSNPSDTSRKQRTGELAKL